MQGVTLGGGAAKTNFSNVEIAEVIYRKTADADVDAVKIRDYAKNKYAIKYKTFQKGVVVFSFDDSTSNFYQEYLDVFVTRGLKATFFISGETATPTTMNYWKDLYDNYGLDPQCHSFHHGLLNKTQEEVITEMILNNELFENYGLPTPEIIAYPNAGVTTDIINWITPYRKMGRTVNSNPFNRSINMYLLGADRADTGDYGLIATIKQHIDWASYYKICCSIYAHGIDNTTIPELLDYVLTKNVDVLTFSELYELLID